MARLLYNNEGGLLGANPGSGGTTITFTIAPNFATLSGSDYIPLVLDAGLATMEIVYLTAYTAAATTGTITRAAEDSANWPAVAHPSGTWVCAPTTNDINYPYNIPSGRIYQTAAQTFSSTGYQQATLGVLDFVRGGVTATSSNSALTVPIAGIYLVTGLLTYNTPSTSMTLIIGVAKNGSIVRDGNTQVTGAAPRLSIADIVTCAAGDVLTLWSFNNTGTAPLYVPQGSIDNYLSALLVSTP